MKNMSMLEPVEGMELEAIEGGHHHHHGGGGGGLGGLGDLGGLGGIGTPTPFGGLPPVNLNLNITNNIAIVAGNFLGAGSNLNLAQLAGAAK
jgi:hypothetical protein